MFNYGILSTFSKCLSTIPGLYYQLKLYMHLLLALGGQKDTVLVNVEEGFVWPKSGLTDCELQWTVYYVQAKVNYFNLYTMARKYRKVAAAHARLARQTQVYTATVRAIASNDSTVQEPNNNNDNINNDDDNFDCGFTGGVHCLLPDTNSNSEFEMDCDLDSESESGESVVELEGKEHESSLAQLRDEVTLLAKPTPYQKRTQEHRLHEAWAREDFCEYVKTSTNPQISMMCAFTQKGAAQKPVHNQHQAAHPRNMQYVPNLLGFLSNFLSDEDDGGSNTNMDHSNDHDDTSHNSSALPQKRQKLKVPYHEQRKQRQAAKHAELEHANKDIMKHLKSKKMVFVGGPHGLQACCACTIEAHLMLVVKNKHGFKVASEMAAETNGFAAKWGGHQVCGWTHEWMRTRMLPVSQWGWHAKILSLLDDPAITSELRTFMCSNKWSMNPQKLAKFMNNELLHTKATKYLEGLVQTEMPQGLKRYIELELFPCIHMKMTTQANDGQSMSWVPDGEYKLRKKGVGQGLHQSSIICSTVGHLEEAAHTIKYGKNYEGYWNGEIFVAQGKLCDKIIPAFEHAHGPGYQALFLIDNSQGHSAYADDALLISCMNVNPGGKQAHMKDG
ncbi:hypothetical protein BD769DRAFT_1389338 [Suillus cothurnatus]|nr:hypothetical protein BD769DRAFT_1389338 [Suillus cothurnatus]